MQNELISIPCGNGFETNLNFKINDSPMDLTGTSLRLDLFDSPNGTNPIISKTFIDYPNPELGSVKIQLTPQELTIKPADYYLEINLIGLNNEPMTLPRDKFQITTSRWWNG